MKNDNNNNNNNNKKVKQNWGELYCYSVICLIKETKLQQL